ncbi:PLDc N-terminal domain-containing protein [Ligilactobacillus faecis]|uniref:PLDc N-terminal domain-containing protein n=1 Tax=Ligilactobacillus faecis TaxID=762833 RepID=A0ABV4DQ58_9LACO
MNLKILIPLILLGIVYLYLCIRSIFWKDETRYLPKIVWLVICLVSIPLGGVLYYFVGREV